jgi:hypothetical protein
MPWQPQETNALQQTPYMAKDGGLLRFRQIAFSQFVADRLFHETR